jgi:hypothetical protein
MSAEEVRGRSGMSRRARYARALPFFHCVNDICQ